LGYPAGAGAAEARSWLGQDEIPKWRVEASEMKQRNLTPEDPESDDPFQVQVFDGFGHWVTVKVYPLESQAESYYDHLLKTNTKYPGIRLIQVLLEAERP
jgi:hypothetical protein